VVFAFEGGTNHGQVGTFTTGDRFRVAVVSGVVKYYKIVGGTPTLLYTSATTPTYPLLVDTAVYDSGCQINNVVISGNLAGAADIEWLVTDQLGTPRMVFDKTGNLATTKRHDYLPFGEELIAGQGVRTGPQGYSVTDGVRQKFTSKEHDNETGLDYFLARYYGSTMGRFTSVDPIRASGKPSTPQSWSRYSYCLNNPLAIVDPTGMIWGYQEFERDGHKYTRLRWFDGNKVGKRVYCVHTCQRRNGRSSRWRRCCENLPKWGS